MKKPIIFFLFIILTSSINAQNINVYNKFADFEHIINYSNDTTYVINFWATWCIPCVKELPYFQQLNDKYNNEKLKVILVSIDMAEKVNALVIPFLQKRNVTVDVVVLDDPRQNSWIGKVDKNWQGSIPGTLIYNSRQRKFFEKSFNFEELEKQVKSFL